MCSAFFFFNDTATTEIYTLSLHDALPIFQAVAGALRQVEVLDGQIEVGRAGGGAGQLAELEALRRLARSEEHTSELQSRQYLVCRLLLEKKKIHRSPLGISTLIGSCKVDR